MPGKLSTSSNPPDCSGSLLGDKQKVELVLLDKPDLQNILEGAKQEIFTTLQLKPASPAAGFVLWNVVALLVGIAESLVWAAAGRGSACSI